MKEERKIWDAEWKIFNFRITNLQRRMCEYLSEIKIKKSCKVLEAGCGTGFGSLVFASRGAEVWLLDISPHAIEQAKKLWKDVKSKKHFIVGDILNLPFKNNFFDITWNQGVLEHFKNPLEVLENLCRVTKPNGLIIIDVPNKYHWTYIYKRFYKLIYGKWKFGYEHEYSLIELENLLKRSGTKPVKSFSYHFGGPISPKNLMIGKIPLGSNIVVIAKKMI